MLRAILANPVVLVVVVIQIKRELGAIIKTKNIESQIRVGKRIIRFLHQFLSC
jgi:hypothetical protein